MRVLVVEDDPADAELALASFSQSRRPRFFVQVAPTLAAALERAGRETFDAVLLDLNLDDSRGLATLSTFCAQVTDAAIIVYSGLDDDQAALEAVRCGAQDYLVKGNRGEDLVPRSVVHSVQRHHKDREIRTLLELVCRSERQLQEKNTRLAELNEVAHQVVDNVSHEFRTPLTVIREYASLMKDGVGGQLAPQHHNFVEIISDRADDLANMVDDMLDVSRLKAGLLGMARTNCQVSDFIDHVRLGLERKAAIRGVELRFDLAHDLPPVFCDPEKAGRIVTNLAVNAIKFSGPHGRVVIRATLAPSSKDALISVADNGPGIEAENLATIFERHKQLANDSGGGKGFGLGLSIAKELVENSFGQISVYSTPGEGSTFTFTLPLANPQEVFDRYLSRLELDELGSRTVSLLHVVAGDQCTLEAADDVDAFLSYLLRRNDLLLRIAPLAWLVVLDADEVACEQFLVRYEKTLTETNRNRLRGPLPPLHVTTEGTWQLPWRHRQVLERAAAFAPAPAPPAPALVPVSAPAIPQDPVLAPAPAGEPALT